MQLQLTLLAFIFVFQLSAQSHQSPEQQKELKILSWNIYMLPGITNISKSIEKSNKRSRAVEIAQMLNASDYDIVVFQESFFAPARRKLKTSLKELFPYQYGPVNPSGLGYKTSSGIFVVSNTPLKELGATQYRSCNGVDCIAKKGAGLFEGQHNGNSFQVLGTHLNAGGPQWIREEQYFQLWEDLLQPFQKMGVPQIVCGDFNTGKHKAAYQILLQTIDAEDTPIMSDRKNTTVKDKQVIDYIFLRRNGSKLKVIDKQVKQFDAKQQVIGKLGGTLSDHLAVDIVLTFD